MSENLEEYALDFFFSKYLLLPCDPDVGRGFLDHVYPVWQQVGPDSPLKPAVLAVAACMLEAWSRIPPGQPLTFSRLQYSKALSAMRKSMQNAEGVTDDVIITALMLDFYEGVRLFCSLQANRSPHVKGAIALIRQGSNQVKAQASQQVLLGARRQILGRALRDRQYMNLNLTDSSPATLRTTGSRMDDLNVEVANLQAMVTQIEDFSLVNNDLLLFILERATELDQRLSIWRSEVPADWNPIRVSGPACIPPSVRKAGLYHDDYCDVYKSIHVANKLNEYRCSRIRLQRITFTCLEELDGRNSESTSVIASDTIQELVDMICDSVPYFLGDRKDQHRVDDRTAKFPHTEGATMTEEHYASLSAYAGFTLVLRLTELMTPDIPLRDGQRQWIGSQIGRVGRIHRVCE